LGGGGGGLIVFKRERQKKEKNCKGEKSKLNYDTIKNLNKFHFLNN
jgi:hypothetical protein